ncbi:hypothetical protein CPB86DRAFT_878755 [Serendipita vermifera]|nr:hypothetical protein CPB86DRAFT_878755 [Serendipita vermifera]
MESSIAIQDYDASPKIEDLRPKSKRKVSNNSNKSHLARAGPITSIPNEILALIFQYYVKMGGTVWDLIPVSKYWEQTAFDTCSLWAPISIQDHTSNDASITELIHNNDTEYYNRPSNGSSKHVCFERRHLSKAISHTGGCFLDLEITHHAKCPQGKSFLEFVLDMLMKPTISTRIKSLELSISTELATIRPDYFCNMSFQNLRRLKTSIFPQEWLRNLLYSISATTKTLEFMNCSSNKPLNWYLSDHILNQVRFLGLGGLNEARQLDVLLPKLCNVEEIVCLSTGHLMLHLRGKP